MCSRFSFYCVNVEFLLYGWVECLSFIDIRLSKYSLKPWTSPCGRKAPGWSRRQCVFGVMFVCSVVGGGGGGDGVWCWQLGSDWRLGPGSGRREEGGGRLLRSGAASHYTPMTLIHHQPYTSHLVSPTPLYHTTPFYHVHTIYHQTLHHYTIISCSTAPYVITIIPLSMHR